MNIKPVFRRILVTVLLLGMALFLVPGVEASEYGDEHQIFEFLTKNMGLNQAAACGIMANMEAESNFRLVCYGDEGTSFGLCQWHNDRFDCLKTFCSSRGYDYRSLEGQLNFLFFDLRNNFPWIYQNLRRMSNDSQGAYDAAYYWCVNYERPAGMEEAGARRGRSAQNYWKRYGSYVPAKGETVVESNGLSSLGNSSSVWDTLFYWEKEAMEQTEEEPVEKSVSSNPATTAPAPTEKTESVQETQKIETTEETESTEATEPTEPVDSRKQCKCPVPHHPPVVPVVDGEPLLEERVIECSCGEMELQFGPQAPVITYEIC